MTATATAPPEVSAEERLRSRALDTIRTESLEIILESNEPLRTADLARLLADSLKLKLSEEELGGLATLVRMVLDNDPLFSQANRQWDLALRMGRAEGDRRKPVERAIEDFIDLIGHPAEVHPVAVLVSSVYSRPVDYFEKMVERLATTREQFFLVPRGRVGISRWLLEISSDDPEDVEYDNFENTAVVDAHRSAAEQIKAGDAASYARELVKRAGGPIDNRALQYFTWRAFPKTVPSRLFAELASGDGLVLERGPSWTTPDDRKRVLAEIQAMSRDPQAVSDLVAASAPVEDEEIGILAPTTIRVSDEDLDQIYNYMVGEQRTYRVPELMQQVLEAFPGSRNYAGIHESLTHRMRDDNRFRWAGAERYRISGTVPRDIEVLPEGLPFDEGEYLGPEGVEIDKFVDYTEWKFHLDQQIKDYLVQELGDDGSEAPGAAPSKVTAVVPLHHYVAGTYYLRNSDRGLFPATPDLVEVTLVAPDGSRQDVWINNRLQLVFGLKDWYEANLPWVGGRFSIERTGQPDEYRLVYTGETEPLMDVTGRLTELIQLRAEAMSEAMPWTDIVTKLLRAHPDGIPFVTLFTELNIVRRTRRTKLASILSGQRYFTQQQAAPGIWSYDEKRATKLQKKKGGPKRPMREAYDDEEDDDLLEEPG